MKILTAAIAAILTTGVAVAGAPQPDCCGGGPGHCYQAAAAHVECVWGITDDYHFKAKTATPTPKTPYLPWQGNTPATVHAQFATEMEWEFRTFSAAQLNKQLPLMDNFGLAQFSQLYYMSSQGHMAPLLNAMAQKLTADNLFRVARAFGADETYAAVGQFAPASVLAAYRALYRTYGAPIPMKQSHAHHAMMRAVAMTANGLAAGKALPTTEMTLREIYTEYLFTEAETTVGALSLTAAWAIAHLYSAAMIGWQVGGVYYAFGDKVDPFFAEHLFQTWNDMGTLDVAPTFDNVTGTGFMDMGGMIEYSWRQDWVNP